MARLPFYADFPGALVYPADDSNYYKPENHKNVPNQPRGFFLHTPEEPWDDYESTPVYFSSPNRQASTHYYMDSDGDVWQLVPERCAAIANGLNGKPRPSWADPGTSLNWQSLSVEIEGYAGQIQDTLIPGRPQFNGLVRLVRDRCAAYGIPLDREHVMGHYEVSVDRSDPGRGFPWDAFMQALWEDDMANQQEIEQAKLRNAIIRTLLREDYLFAERDKDPQTGERIVEVLSGKDTDSQLLIRIR